MVNGVHFSTLVGQSAILIHHLHTNSGQGTGPATRSSKWTGGAKQQQKTIMLSVKYTAVTFTVRISIL